MGSDLNIQHYRVQTIDPEYRRAVLRFKSWLETKDLDKKKKKSKIDEFLFVGTNLQIAQLYTTRCLLFGITCYDG